MNNSNTIQRFKAGIQHSGNSKAVFLETALLNFPFLHKHLQQHPTTMAILDVDHSF